MTTATQRPIEERSLPVRFMFYVFGYVRGMPFWLRTLFGVMFVIAVGAGGYYLLERRVRGQTHAAEREGWRLFEEAVRSSDWDGMDAALAAVLEANPDDLTARTRRQSLATNNAADNDPSMPFLTMRKAMRDGDEAAIPREARKLLVHAPQDWLGHCVLASEALEAGDQETAKKEVDQLVNPASSDANVQPGVLLNAFQLFRRVGRDVAPLREFVQSNVARRLKSDLIKNQPALLRLAVIECYFQGLEPGEVPQPSPIVEGFAPARDLVATATADLRGTPDALPLLIRGAKLMPEFELAATRFARRGQITETQLNEFIAEDRDRAEHLWQEVLELDPKTGEAYRSLAAIAARRGHFDAAQKYLDRGIAACQDDPVLAEIQAFQMRERGRGVEAARRLAAEARSRPDQQIWWRVAVNAARLAGRADLAFELLAESRKIHATERWTTVAEAELRLNAGDPAAASDLLTSLGHVALLEDPLAIRLAARAFTMSGRQKELDDLATLVESRAVSTHQSAGIEALLAGLADAPPEAKRLAHAVQLSEVTVRRFPDEPALQRILARIRFQIAELGNWERGVLNPATAATVRYLAMQPDDREAATWLATLKLYGEDQPRQAVRDLDPVRRAETQATSGQLTLLGEALRRAGDAAEALRVLQVAAAKPGAAAGVYVQQALALQATGNADAARTILTKAQQLPRTAREQADYTAAARLLY